MLWPVQITQQACWVWFCGSSFHIHGLLGFEKLCQGGGTEEVGRQIQQEERRGSRRSAVLGNHSQRNVNIWKLHAGGFGSKMKLW